MDLDEIRCLGELLEELLPVRSIVDPGEGAAFDSLYLLAGLQRPSLLEAMRGGPLPEEPPPRETYVRLAFSRLGRFVAMQEVVVASARADGALEIVEQPIVGFDDRRLQAIVKCLQGALKKARVVVLDLAFLTDALPSLNAGDVGGPPAGESAWSFLFSPDPPGSARIVRI